MMICENYFTRIVYTFLPYMRRTIPEEYCSAIINENTDPYNDTFCVNQCVIASQVQEPSCLVNFYLNQPLNHKPTNQKGKITCWYQLLVRDPFEETAISLHYGKK